MATTSVANVKAQLVSVLTSLFASDTTVQVTYGLPGTLVLNDVVAVTDIDVDISRPTMGTNRSREEVSTVTVLCSVFRFGDQTQQQVATERAIELADVVQQRFRTAPNETLNGACREAYVLGMALQESDDPQVMEKGRSATVTLSVIAHARI